MTDHNLNLNDSALEAQSFKYSGTWAVYATLAEYFDRFPDRFTDEQMFFKKPKISLILEERM